MEFKDGTARVNFVLMREIIVSANFKLSIFITTQPFQLQEQRVMSKF